MSFLRRPKVTEPPRPIDPADTANRADQVRQKRLRGGGTASTFLSQAVGETAVAGPRPTLTGAAG